MTKNKKPASISDEILKNKIKFIDAGWRKFKLSIVDAEFLKKDETKETDCYGATDSEKCLIEIAKNNEDDLVKETILHELTHVMLENIGLGEDNIKRIQFDNEHLTTMLSRELMRMIDDNTKLFEILIKPWEPIESQNR